jgi:hypothetical protein
MGADICGFLEISRLDEVDLQDEYAWMSCLDLSNLALSTGDICSILFGESKYGDTPNGWQPIAKRRGLPPNMAWLTTQAVKGALANDSTLMSTWGYTFISYEEIATIDWQTYAGAAPDLTEFYEWGLLFSLMKTLDNSSHH